MTGWLKLPEEWFDRSDVEGLPAEVLLFHMSALAASCRHMTDGFIARRTLRHLWEVADVAAAVAALVDADWWRPADDGWQIGDWNEFILAKSEVEHRRQQSRESTERNRRHGRGDHSMCTRCAFVRDESRGGSLTAPVPDRPVPNRSPKGGGEGGPAAPGLTAARLGSQLPNVGSVCTCTAPTVTTEDGDCVGCGGVKSALDTKESAA